MDIYKSLIKMEIFEQQSTKIQKQMKMEIFKLDMMEKKQNLILNLANL